jgi:iron complex transport system permease protein
MTECHLVTRSPFHLTTLSLTRPYLPTLALLALALLFSIAIGAVVIPPGLLTQAMLARGLGWAAPDGWTPTFEAILFKLRLPHTILMLLTGAALAGSGAAYQGLFRNPLADPYLIGVASGAGLGAVLAMSLFPAATGAVTLTGATPPDVTRNWASDALGLYAVPAAAFVGALITVGLVYTLAHRGTLAPNTTLILAGVAVSAFATAITSFLMLRSQGELHRAVAWLMGGGSLSGWNPVIAGLPYIVIGLGLLLTQGHALNVLQFGEEQAQQLGLAVQRRRLIIIVAASLATAAAVAFAGIIGFVGLIVPHIVRLLWTADYRRLIPLSILNGATALLLADLLARTVMAPQELPVGIITALAGAPFFLWVLRKGQSGGE